MLAELAHPERVLFFEIEPIAVASRELRARLAAGDDVAAELPSAVAASSSGEPVCMPRQAGYTGAA